MEEDTRSSTCKRRFVGRHRAARGCACDRRVWCTPAGRRMTSKARKISIGLALDGETEGFARVHADRKGRILGATLVSRHAGESIGEVVLAMTHGLRLGALS